MPLDDHVETHAYSCILPTNLICKILQFQEQIMSQFDTSISTIVEEYKKVTDQIPNVELGAELKVISALKISNGILEVMGDLEQDPYALLIPLLEKETNGLSKIHFSELGDVDKTNESIGNVSATKKLYENIWTIYNNDTYDHSMQLCLERFKANGFDESFFEGKSVFDGGCGTGRFCIAAALLGAKKVYGMDLGGQSLTFAQNKAVEYHVSDKVEFLEGDVTELQSFADGSIDFIVSNGVLHHTADPLKGLSEHFRVLKPSGVLWLYLYGKNGLLWNLYDVLQGVLKDVGPDFSRSLLLKLDIRQGMIYSFMDNVFAPIRNHYNSSGVLSEMSDWGAFTAIPMRGINFLDDSVLQMESKYGKTLLGEECEVRQLITKEG